MTTLLRYDRSTRPFGWAMVGVSVAELVAVELLVPWPTVRLVLLVLGVLSLAGVVWLVLRLGRRPHRVTDTALILHAGLSAEVRIPLGDVERVTTGQRAASRDGVSLDPAAPEGQGQVAVLAVSSTTNLEVRLRGPRRLDVTNAKALAGAPDIVAVRFWADDPSAAHDALTRALANPPSPTS